MAGETDLQRLLAGMRPSMSETAFAFATARSLQDVPASVSIIGCFNEDEGVTVIATLDQLARTGLMQSGPFAKISLAVHSSLAAVGLTAKISTSLAQGGISANIVAGYFHDLIFVPWEERHAALDILSDLGAERI
jgi:hypothetical protein